MKNTFYILLFGFVCLITDAMAQHNITGQLKPNIEGKKILLYKTEGAFQYYKSSTEINEDGFFGFAFPQDFATGSYRLVYNVEKNYYINFIYNNEEVSFVADPNDIVNSIYFIESKENSLYYDYIKQINIKYTDLDSIQGAYYNQLDNKSSLKKIAKSYLKKVNEINAFQLYFEQISEGTIAQSFIKAFAKTISKVPFKSEMESLKYLKANYLENTDFNDLHLKNSSYLLDLISEYVFDLNELYAQVHNSPIDLTMIDKALSKLEASTLKNEIIYSLTKSAYDPYSSKYDFYLDYLYSKYYQFLPESDKNKSFTELASKKITTIIGKKAPNIFLDQGSLYEIKNDNVLVIFWSTTCSHCLKEIPIVYNLLKDREDLEVLLVGLEEVYSDWENVILSFPKWQHLRANGKWDNKYSKLYNIKSTPSYFLLNENKYIIAKPENSEEVKELFELKK